MSGILSRWSIMRRYEIGPDDLDSDGAVRGDVIGSWAGDVIHDYLAQCPVLDTNRARNDLDLDLRFDVPSVGDPEPEPDIVAVSASASEFAPTSIVISVRMRGVRAEDRALDIRCAIRCLDRATGEPHEFEDDVRDELIALEHAASHFN